MEKLKSRKVTVDVCLGMSEIEALLSIDAGIVPEGIQAFFPRDPGSAGRRLQIVLAVAAGVAGCVCAFVGAGRVPSALLILAAAFLAIKATPIEDDDGPRPGEKRPVLVLTTQGIIVRDAAGLRSWRFEELAEVRPFVFQQRVGVLVVQRDGGRDFIDTMSFRRGECVNELVGRRLKPHVI